MTCNHSPEFACVECAAERVSVETPLAVNDGDWIIPAPQQGFLWGCCDCGLMHSVDFRVVDSQVELRVYRDVERTTELRAKLQRVRSVSAEAASIPEATNVTATREDCYQCDGDGYAGIHNCPRCGGSGKEVPPPAPSEALTAAQGKDD